MDGAETALLLSNAINMADRLDIHSMHWGIFENDRALQTKARLRAWQQIQALRKELVHLVDVELTKVVEDMEKEATRFTKLAVYQRDLKLKRDLVILLGRGKTTQEETLALLAMWSASPFF